MALNLRPIDQFPTIYEDGRPTAVLVDLPTFQALVAAAERLDALAAADEPWLSSIIERIRAHRRQHPETLMAFATPDAALAALDAPDD